jgi:hypothetical protein
MYLADPEIVRSSLGFSDMADINNAINDALDTATSMLASTLTSDFTKKTWTEFFFVQEPAVRMGAVFEQQTTFGDGIIRGGASGQTEFRLSTGFVSALTAISFASQPTDFGTSDIDLSSTVTLFSDKGVIKDHVTDYSSSFVKAVYVAGFDPDNSNPNMYNLSQVPKWLQDAARVQAKILLADHPMVTEADIKIDTKTLSTQLKYLISSRIRYAPAALLPV